MLGILRPRAALFRMNLVIPLILIFKSLYLTSGELTCKNKEGKDVDWFIIYKLPRDSDSSHALIQKGLGYFYMDSNKQNWTMGTQSLNDTNQPVYFTLQHIYKHPMSEDQAFLSYNDETPEHKVSFRHGHTKGVIGFDQESGYWLVHSLPRFPPRSNESYSWPHSGLMYGQTFLCISMKYKQLDLIGQQLLYTYPWIYDSKVPVSFLNNNPHLEAALQKKHVKSQPWNQQLSLESMAGQTFISFAKYVDFNADIYSSWLAPYFQSTMYTETWQNGKGKSPSNCSAHYQVENIQDVQIEDTLFKETRDHSKWGITLNKENPWICIGGINRMTEQAHRAGGMVCANLPQVWQSFRNIIAQIEKCPSTELDKTLALNDQNKIYQWDF